MIKIVASVMLIASVIVFMGFLECKRLLHIVYPNLWERDCDAKKAIQVSLVLFMPIISVIFFGLSIFIFFKSTL